MKSEFLHQYRLQHGATFRSRLLARIDKLGEWGSRTAPLSNWLAASAPARWLADVLFGLDYRRLAPPFARQTFLAWWAAQAERFEHGHGNQQPRFVLFGDTFTNFH